MDISDEKIVIVSGEGENVHIEEYKGKKTPHAIKIRLTKERCNGDRWARAIQYMWTNDNGRVGQNMETGELCVFPG
jgi:hypothetical protein